MRACPPSCAWGAKSSFNSEWSAPRSFTPAKPPKQPPPKPLGEAWGLAAFSGRGLLAYLQSGQLLAYQQSGRFAQANYLEPLEVIARPICCSAGDISRPK